MPLYPDRIGVTQDARSASLAPARWAGSGLVLR